MEIWITRNQTGVLLEHYASPDELEENVKSLEVYEEFTPSEDVKVEITGRWSDIKQFFQDIQLMAEMVRGQDFDKDSEPDKLIKRMSERKLIK
jgi:Tfp pilus assembly protein PilO